MTLEEDARWRELQQREEEAHQVLLDMNARERRLHLTLMVVLLVVAVATVARLLLAVRCP